MTPKSANGPRYHAPALEKGLDILELLATEVDGLGQSETARRLGRSSGEIFRMLACLERRGYIDRSRGDERYRLTSKLFELAHYHPPTKKLLQTALPEMQRLAAKARQSCHLAVRHEDQILIVAQVDGPGFMGFSVRVGAQIPLLDACSGQLLLAMQDPTLARLWVPESGLERFDSLADDFAKIKRDGYHHQSSQVTRGVVDLSRPVCDHTGQAIAALTVPCIDQIGDCPSHQDVLALLNESTAAVSLGLGSAAGAVSAESDANTEDRLARSEAS